MVTGFIHLHSLLAYVAVIMLFIATTNALMGLMGKRSFVFRDFRISLFTLIITHFQILVGLVLFFFSPMVQWFNANTETAEIMKNSQLRLLNLEHPLIMIVAVILLTIGYSKHKKKTTDSGKFKTILIFYGIALLLVLTRIPWDRWF